ncbi:NitT/TauT family transport system substrate-binding protein [Gammaproteobacteria bacterium]
MLKIPYICGVLLLACIAPSHASTPQHLDSINVQLRWIPQFQFAGYYAAVEKGFYKDEGLDVRLHAGAPDRQPVTEVISGRAQYAEGNSEVLLARLQGMPLVALAAIFQHSPSVLLALRKSGIQSPHDLIGKKVMFMDSKNDPDFLTMLLNEGIQASKLTILPSSFNFDDLIDGKVDAFNSYLTNEPFFLKQRGIEFTVINPRNYRVDFYSDILFTTESEVKEHPERVEAMRRATFKGWRYAMDHPNEIIDILINKYEIKKSREHLEFEVDAMRSLILPDLVEIGHMNPERWRQMADTFVQSNLIGSGYSLKGFLYETQVGRRLPEWALLSLIGATSLLILISLVAIYFHNINRRLVSAETNLRTANEALTSNLAQIQELHHQLQEQAIRDPLTGLYNRRYLDETLDRELARAKRDGYPVSVCMIDLDHFKLVNDTYGHKAGDEVLKSLGALLRSDAREGDIPCRYGGEEFVLVSPHMHLDVAKQRIEQWVEAFGGMKTRHGELEIGTTMSVGLATYPIHGATAEALIVRADEALYKAKAAGRNRLEIAVTD